MKRMKRNLFFKPGGVVLTLLASAVAPFLGVAPLHGGIAVPELKVTCEKPADWKIALDRVSESDGLAVWRVSARAEKASPPPTFEVSFVHPGENVHHLWHSGSQYFAPMSQPSRMTPVWDGIFRSRFAYYLPLYAFIGDADDNRLTLAVSEAREEIVFNGGADHDKGLAGRFTFFEKPALARTRTDYEAYLRVDARNVAWWTAVHDAVRWMESAANLPPLNAPVIAFDPVYSTWYAHQEKIDAATVEAECAEAAKCGMKTVIVDDGWQTEKPCNYANAGDWELCEKKFPNMREHVANIHRLGMKYVMWYALPYLGKESKAFARFQDKLLILAPRYGVLDPRYPEVRAYLAGVCAKAMREWDVDGFKLDYIDTLKIWDGNDPGEKTDWKGMDTKSVSEAAEKLLKEILVSLRKIKADALVEFRQHYTGPAVRQYGNMMRVSDCPCDTFANRCSIAALRLTCPGTAVHSDMLTWDPRTSAEDAALQILNSIFGVVQYSPRFPEMPLSHRNMIGHWVAFSIEHREALLFGTFRAHHPELNYTLFEGETARERVLGVYDSRAVIGCGAGEKDVYVINATPSETLALELSRERLAEVFDTFGRKVASTKVARGLSRVEVPPSGYLKLLRSEQPLVFSSGGATLALLPASGAVVSLKTEDGVERLAAADEAFTLQFLDGNGLATRLRSSAFKFAPHGNVLVWTHANGLSVTMRVAADGGEFSFTPEVTGIPSGYSLEWFDGPQVFIANDRTLYWPFYDGCEVTDFSNREGREWTEYRPLGYTPRRKAWGSLYPGSCQMQFMAAYKDGHGVYFSAVDPRHTPKGVEYDWMTPNTTRLSLQTFCGDLTAGAWKPGFHYLVKPYNGGWMEACEFYRDWVRTLPGFDKPPARPEWAYESPINLIYPVQGEGIDHGPAPLPPNRYFPFMNVMPEVEKYGRLFDSKLMALIMHWEGTAPWCPPYVWPPLGGEAGLAKLRDALHARGDLLGLYCSGTAWTQTSSINGYSQEKKCREERLERWMMRGPQGQIDATICNDPVAQRLGYDMCLTEEWPIRTLQDELGKIARFGIDYCQYFDQNIGGGCLLCYAKHHAHPPVPGAWQTDSMLALQKKMFKTIEKANSKMTLGCEACAATPYARNLFYNDSRAGNDLPFGTPVPGVPFVFHEWMSNFSGNQIGHTSDPHYRWSRALHYGESFAVILGPDGKLVNAWGVDWSKPLPDQEDLIKLVHNLNEVRKANLPWLLEGRMVKPFARVESAAAVVRQDKYTIRTTDVLSSFWQAPNGLKRAYLSNWRTRPSTADVTFESGLSRTCVLEPLETIVLDCPE